MLSDASEEVAAMDSLQGAVNSIKFSNGFEPFGYTRMYIQWETNKVSLHDIHLIVSICSWEAISMSTDASI